MLAAVTDLFYIVFYPIKVNRIAIVNYESDLSPLKISGDDFFKKDSPFCFAVWGYACMPGRWYFFRYAEVRH